ncbi:hypothetical protein DENSPDRAFT_885029 [Dentipellis sp. KUC8613]|nr:hypothetical protein DENSPDRAFT_885029 [Dentipellis sp. KUC8613]
MAQDARCTPPAAVSPPLPPFHASRRPLRPLPRRLDTRSRHLSPARTIRCPTPARRLSPTRTVSCECVLHPARLPHLVCSVLRSLVPVPCAPLRPLKHCSAVCCTVTPSRAPWRRLVAGGHRFVAHGCAPPLRAFAFPPHSTTTPFRVPGTPLGTLTMAPGTLMMPWRPYGAPATTPCAPMSPTPTSPSPAPTGLSDATRRLSDALSTPRCAVCALLCRLGVVLCPTPPPARPASPSSPSSRRLCAFNAPPWPLRTPWGRLSPCAAVWAGLHPTPSLRAPSRHAAPFSRPVTPCLHPVGCLAPHPGAYLFSHRHARHLTAS